MSVEYTYLSLPWTRIAGLQGRSEPSAWFMEAMEEEPDWLEEVPFGQRIDRYFFSSFNALSALSEWLVEEVGEASTSGPLGQWKSVLMDLGMLYGPDYKNHPIRIGLEADDWLIAAIPPDEVGRLCATAQAIEADPLRAQMERILRAHPLQGLDSAELFVAWSQDLGDGLAAVNAETHGIVVGAA